MNQAESSPAILVANEPVRKADRDREWGTLLVIVLVAGGLRLWRLDQNGYGNFYYAAAVRSMLESGSNFFFGSFDPAGFVTVDKPPVAIWIQAASAKLLGFRGVSLLLPEALMGIASVLLTYHLVRRVFGAAAGLLAGLFLAITPICVAVDRDNLPDPALVFVLLLAAWALVDRRGDGAVEAIAAVGGARGSRIQRQNARRVRGAADLLSLLSGGGAHQLAFAVRAPRGGDHDGRGGLALVVDRRGADAEVSAALYRRLAEQLGARPGAGLQRARPGARRQRQLPSRSPGPLPRRRAPATNDAPAPAKEKAKADDTAKPKNEGGEKTEASIVARAEPPSTVSPPVDMATAPPPTARPRRTLRPARPVADSPVADSPVADSPAAARDPADSVALPGSCGSPRRSWPARSPGCSPSPSSAEPSRRPAHLGAWPLTPEQLGLLLWAGWLGTHWIVFTFAQGIFHEYYTTIMGPAVAALAGIGVVALHDEWRQSEGHRGYLPSALILTAAWQAYVINQFPEIRKLILPALGIGTVVSLIVLVTAQKGIVPLDQARHRAGLDRPPDRPRMLVPEHRDHTGFWHDARRKPVGTDRRARHQQCDASHAAVRRGDGAK